jgi:hypothetical protein
LSVSSSPVVVPRRRRRPAAPLLFAALATLAAGACGPKRPPLVVAMEPRPNPPLVRHPDNPRERLRQNRWLAQFWEELTPSQRRRVEARMLRAKPPMAPSKEGAAQVWDGLGLAERDRLVFGGGGAPARSATAAAAASAASAAPEPESPSPTP